MGKIWDYIKARLGEPTTWKGLITLLTILGVNINPEQQTAIVTVGAAIVSAIWVFAPDKKVANGVTK